MMMMMMMQYTRYVGVTVYMTVVNGVTMYSVCLDG